MKILLLQSESNSIDINQLYQNIKLVRDGDNEKIKKGGDPYWKGSMNGQFTM